MANLNPTSVTNLISLREKGMLKTNFYKDRIINAQINREPQQPRRIEDMFKIFHFEFIRSDSDGNLVGVNHTDSNLLYNTKFISRVYVMEFAYKPVCVQGPSDSNSLITSLSTKKMLRECIVMTDTADVHINGKKPMLFCGSNYSEGMAGLTYFNCEGKNLDYEWRIEGKAFCCTSCDFSKQFALGGEDGFFLFNTSKMNEKRELINENVLGLQFSSDGNFLLVSTDKRGVSIFDVREHFCYRRYCAIKDSYGMSCRKRYPIKTTSSYVREIKFLDDQISLICADMDGYMEKIDIRMMRPVFQYEGHKGHSYIRYICLNEDLNLVCAPGKDKVVRIWSLSSGKLIYERKVFDRTHCFINDEPPHCCFVSNQRRWFLSVIQDNVLIPVALNEDFPGYNTSYKTEYQYKFI